MRGAGVGVGLFCKAVGILTETNMHIQGQRSATTRKESDVPKKA